MERKSRDEKMSSVKKLDLDAMTEHRFKDNISFRG